MPPVRAAHGVAALAPEWEGRAPHQVTLQPRAIHLWAVQLQDFAHAQSYAGRIAMQREMRAAGRAALRMFLCAYTGLCARELQLEKGARGKPLLRNVFPHGELCFNYTISRAHALFAFSWNRQLGIDLETLPRRIDSARMAKRKLGDCERRAWHAVPAENRDAAMLACWTRKEAYGKALGVGIRYFLHEAPLCASFDSPRWRSGVHGLFARDHASARALHGMQIAPPFAGVAALVHDGDAGAQLQCSRLRASNFCGGEMK